MASVRESASQTLPEMLRGFVVLRVAVVSTLLLSAFLIQLTFNFSLPLNPIYYLAAFAYSISILAVLSLQRLPAEANAGIQILGDLAVITALVYISGGPDSSFTFLYLATVAAGAVLLGARGGLTAAGLAAVFYAVLVDLMYYRVLPTPPGADVRIRAWTPAGLVGNVALNVGAFVATALLVTVAARKLNEARAAAERRQAEIARLQALHSSVLNSLSSGVLTADLAGLVTFANPAALDLLHLSSVEVVGRPVLSLGLVEEPDWEEIRGSGGGLLRFERARSVRGEPACFGISVTALRDEEGAAIGRVLIFQNVTKLKRLEGEVRLKEKMAAVGELAAGIAHEIRNPLASISGSVQVLKGTAGPTSPERRLMEIVVQESQRLSAVLEDFLRYVRPRERAVEPVDAPAALRDVLTLLNHSEEVSPAHEIRADLVPPSLVISGDPGQLRQIFWNVARNALAAMPGGGILTVTAREEGSAWVVSFADEGRGMTPDERDHLFTPFAQTLQGRTGLGLAIVYRIVEEHGVTIRIETEPHRGTSITITLPKEGVQKREEPRRPRSSAETHAFIPTEIA